MSVAGDAIDVGCKPSARSSCPSECCVSADIDLTDGAVATELADDASLEYQIPHRRMMACERSARQKNCQSMAKDF